MEKKTKYYVVREKAVPEVLLKVVEAKRILDSERATTVQEATEQVGISRSSFYKYKDDIFPFHDQAKGRTVTFILQMDDKPGILSDILRTVAEFRGNILTIHQSIPINGIATLTLSVEILPEAGDAEDMIGQMEQQTGVHYLKILGREEKQMIQIAVLGYGTVGSGVVEVINRNQESINKKAGEEINIKYVLDLRDFPGDPVQEKIVHDYEIILNDPEIGIVVEVMGGVEPANTFVRKALEAGKSVVTSNKALVAKYGSALLKTAREKNVNFLFEASVGGGIPILRALGSSLTGDEIEEIAGILNGTTNYMMTRMFYEGANYEEVLREAQKNGFAEADPTADVEGQDACRKIAILASIISGKYVDFEEIYTEGITKITTEDMQYAKALGMNIKLLAECKHVDGTLYAGVAPVLLHAEHPLYSVNGVFNAVFVKGNMLGDAMFYGSGAGKLPTASAVVADIVAVVQNQGRDIMNFWSEEKLTLEDRSKTSKKFLVRILGNEDAFKERIGNDFGEVRFVEAGVNGEFGFVTPVMTEGEYEEKAKAYPEILHMIRVQEEV